MRAFFFIFILSSLQVLTNEYLFFIYKASKKFIFIFMSTKVFSQVNLGKKKKINN